MIPNHPPFDDLPTFTILTHILTLTNIRRPSPILGSTHIMTLGPRGGHTRFRKRSRKPASGDCPGSFRRYFTNRSLPGPFVGPKGEGGNASGPASTASQWWPPKAIRSGFRNPNPTPIALQGAQTAVDETAAKRHFFLTNRSLPGPSLGPKGWGFHEPRTNSFESPGEGGGHVSS